MVSLGCLVDLGCPEAVCRVCLSGVSNVFKVSNVCAQEQEVRMGMKRTAKDLVAARVGSWPYIKRRLSNDKGFGNEASATQNVDLDNMLMMGVRCSEPDD